MSGVSAKCYATKWHRRRGSHRNDVDDQKSRHTKPSCRANVRASDRVFGLWFVFARGSCARPPVSGALPQVISSKRLSESRTVVDFIHICKLALTSWNLYGALILSIERKE